MSSSAASSPTVPAVPVAPRPPRSLAPDIARGLMLALIAVANVSWFLWGHEGGVGMTPHVPALGPADTVVQVIMTVAVDHRAMPLFAFLFGYGMVQFYRSRIDRGLEARTVRRMLRRRHWAMLLLGLLHAALLFFGDILGAYAVAGLLLVWIFFGRRTRTLVIWAGIIGGIMALFAVLSVVSAVVLAAFAPSETLDQMGAPSAAYSNDWLRDAAYGTAYLPSVLNRIGFWVVALLPAALAGAALPILLGWIAARHRLLDEPWRHRRTLTRLAIGGIAIGWLTGVPDALAIAGGPALPESLSWAFLGLSSLGGTLCGIGYAAAFGLLALRGEGRAAAAPEPAPTLTRDERTARRRERAAADRALDPAERAYGVPAGDAGASPTAAPPGLLRMLSAVGQRSLTFYLFQSLLIAPLMAGWGLGLAPSLSTWSAVAIALGVWLLSLPIAAWMDTRGMRGPAEALLRRMTYGRHDRARAGAQRPA
ncbi:DUF418 domain-containing protein [Brachybacterium sp. YJGR34]|uniref:DUF418 domain-containing protein n=1 Tax=Brachybacterium sp. YJGR34 TaxID=2059911 RepID=UPI001300A8C7|nr:DUF418 domain-containing protein [Brachybacterium sp. YJGR34]